MIHPLFTGIGTALILTLIPGPVFFGLIQTSIQKGVRFAGMFALGVAFSDLACIICTYYFVASLIKDPLIQNIIAIGGGILMCIFGLFYFFKPAEKSVPLNPMQKEIKGGNFLLKGFILNIFNPTVLFSWFAVVGLMSVKYHNDQLLIFTYFVSLILTILMMDVLKSYIATRIKKVFTNTVMTRLNKGLGIALFGIGVKFLFDAYVGNSFF